VDLIFFKERMENHELLQDGYDGFENEIHSTDNIFDLLPRIRILAVFSIWWEELERVLYADTTRTVQCLNVISRIIEDATFASSTDLAEIARSVTVPDNVTVPDFKLLKEEVLAIIERIVKVIVEDFADIAYSVFQLTSTSTDASLMKAVGRFLVAFKNACVKTFEDFYTIFQTEALEGFITANLNHSDEITSARVAYITGEFIEDTNSESPVPITDFIQRTINKFQTSFNQAKAMGEDAIPQLITRLHQRTLYLFHNSLSIPVPTDLTQPNVVLEQYSGWLQDDCNDVHSLEYLVSVAIGNLRLLASVADYTETLTPVIESDLVHFCLESLHFPLFDLQSVTLSWFGSAMAHKRIASEFVEKNGFKYLFAMMAERQEKESFVGASSTVTFLEAYTNNQLSYYNSEEGGKKKTTDKRNTEGNTKLKHEIDYHDIKAQHISFIIVALSKHSQIIEQYLSSYEVAYQLVSFQYKLLIKEKILDTQLNIIEWFSDCFGHPFILTAIHQLDLLELFMIKLELTFVEEQSLLTKGNNENRYRNVESILALNYSLRREIIRSLLKYVTIHLHYEILYTKKFFDDKNDESLNIRSNSIRSSSNTGIIQSPVFTRTGTEETSLNAQVVNELKWLNSFNLVKLDENQISQLEFYVLHYLIENGHLPEGMKMGLFQSTHSLLPLLPNEGFMSDLQEDDSISLASTVKKSNTQWIVAQEFLKLKVIPILLKILFYESKDSSIHILTLCILELLCLDYTMILEIQHCQIASSSSSFTTSYYIPTLPLNHSLSSLLPETVVNGQQQPPLPPLASTLSKKGIEIVLLTISPEGSSSRKDPIIIISALKLLSAMCTPPYYRYKGNNLNKAKLLLSEAVKRQTNANTSMNSNTNQQHQQQQATKKSLMQTPIHPMNPLQSNKKLHPNQLQQQQQQSGSKESMKLETIQKAVRVAIRSYAGITSLVQLIHYKKNQFYILNIRLETIRVLIGIAQDNEIKMILSKMRIPIILENQMKNENNDLSLLSNNPSSLPPTTTPLFLTGKTIDKDLLILYSDSLIKIITKSLSMDGAGNEITDENLDATQEILDRKAIVEHSHVSCSHFFSFLSWSFRFSD
jgi:hypothetical protein